MPNLRVQKKMEGNYLPSILFSIIMIPLIETASPQGRNHCIALVDEMAI
jgi:hypothetical protein